MVLPEERRHGTLHPELNVLQKRLSTFRRLAELHLILRESLVNASVQDDILATVLEAMEIQGEPKDDTAPFAEVHGKRQDGVRRVLHG